MVLVNSGYKTDSGEIQSIAKLLIETSCLLVHVFAIKSALGGESWIPLCLVEVPLLMLPMETCLLRTQHMELVQPRVML